MCRQVLQVYRGTAAPHAASTCLHAHYAFVRHQSLCPNLVALTARLQLCMLFPFQRLHQFSNIVLSQQPSPVHEAGPRAHAAEGLLEALTSLKLIWDTDTGLRAGEGLSPRSGTANNARCEMQYALWA